MAKKQFDLEKVKAEFDKLEVEDIKEHFDALKSYLSDKIINAANELEERTTKLISMKDSINK